MRHIRIKMWDEDLVNAPPIFIEYWVMEEVSKEDFKQVARNRFEKILTTWEKVYGEVYK